MHVCFSKPKGVVPKKQVKCLRVKLTVPSPNLLDSRTCHVPDFSQMESMIKEDCILSNEQFGSGSVDHGTILAISKTPKEEMEGDGTTLPG